MPPVSGDVLDRADQLLRERARTMLELRESLGVDGESLLEVLGRLRREGRAEVHGLDGELSELIVQAVRR